VSPSTWREHVRGWVVEEVGAAPRAPRRPCPIGHRERQCLLAVEDPFRLQEDEVARLQELLRAAVRRCIEDDGFREVFTDDDAIRERWPVTA
jgi:hypothetical protein